MNRCTTAFKQLTPLIALLAVATLADAEPLATSFTYQGELRDGGVPANGEYDFQFELYDALNGGALMGTAVFIENATVTDGVFSVELDFGPGPFAGDQLWLEIGVRDGASSGGYQGLAPRQKLTAAPYALHAEMVAMDAIGAAEIANNSITAADLAGDSVGVAQIACDAVQASELADNAVDTAAVQDNAITSSKVADNSLTAADLAANSVSSSEVIDDSLTAADLAVDSVQAAEIDAGAVGASGIDPSQVQRRVTGLCPSGQYLRGINQDGTALCEVVPKDRVIITADDPANNVGWFTSIAIGSDNLPVISYWDASGDALKVAHCNDVACSGNDETITTVDDPANSVGVSTSIAIGSDNLPVISYYDNTADALKVVRCGTPDCAL